MRLSVIICTKNRPNLLVENVRSLLRNSISYMNYEILIIDQSDNSNTKTGLKTLLVKFDQLPIIRYFKYNIRGLSQARNFAIGKASGTILCFTDDDCIVSDDWLISIQQAFSDDKLLKALFGQVLPYKKNRYLHLKCPSTCSFKKTNNFYNPGLHRFFIFTGSNMSIKKNLFTQVGLFRTWLGLGSIGISAEEEEFTYRCLKAGFKVRVEPSIKVYHNRWVASTDYDFLLARYTTGFIGAFTFYCLKGDKIAINYLITEVKKIFKQNLTSLFSYIYKVNIILFVTKLYYFLLQLIFMIRGVIVGAYYGLIVKEP